MARCCTSRRSYSIRRRIAPAAGALGGRRATRRSALRPSPRKSHPREGFTPGSRPAGPAGAKSRPERNDARRNEGPLRSRRRPTTFGRSDACAGPCSRRYGPTPARTGARVPAGKPGRSHGGGGSRPRRHDAGGADPRGARPARPATRHPRGSRRKGVGGPAAGALTAVNRPHRHTGPIKSSCVSASNLGHSGAAALPGETARPSGREAHELRRHSRTDHAAGPRRPGRRPAALQNTAQNLGTGGGGLDVDLRPAAERARRRRRRHRRPAAERGRLRRQGPRLPAQGPGRRPLAAPRSAASARRRARCSAAASAARRAAARWRCSARWRSAR